jgi:deazaflavin-dependent oxidoreductase (nitroreductase family)
MWFNPLMTWILRSPFHGMLDKGIILVSVTGRKTGKVYTTPVNYLRDGETLWLTSKRDRTWWRNLKEESPVGVLLAGRERVARGVAIVEEEAVAESMNAYFRLAPHTAKYFKVALDSSGKPVAEDCQRAAKDLVMVRLDLE